MNRTATVVLLLVALALVMFLVLTRSGTVDVGGEPTPTEESVVDIQPLFEEVGAQVAIAFSIVDNETGERFAAEAAEDDITWTVVESNFEPEEGQVDDSIRLNAAGRSLTTLNSSRRLSELETLGEYGLESARYTLIFQTLSGDEFTVFIGGTNPQGSQYYVQTQVDSLVHLISAASMDVYVNLLEDTPYTEPTPTPVPIETPLPITTPTPPS